MKGDFAQAREAIEDLAPGLWIEFFALRNIGLHGRDPKRFCLRRSLDAVESKRAKRDDPDQRQGNVEMRSHSICSRFEK